MKKFNLYQCYDKNYIYTFDDLETEILVESYKYWLKNDVYNLAENNNLYEKFINDDKSGIINKLNEIFGFDIIAIAQGDNKKTFEMFKLLKYLYFLDKHDRIKGMKKLQEKNFVFLDLLAKPRLENFNTNIPAKSIYGDILEKIRLEISSAVPNGDGLYYRIFQINYNWQYALSKLTEYILTDIALEDANLSLCELKRIKNLLNENIYCKINNISVPKLQCENILEGFLNIINTHIFLCSNYDNSVINNSFIVPVSPSEKYINEYRKFDKVVTTWDILDYSKKFIEKGNGEDCAKLLFKMTLNSSEINKEFLKNYKFALKYAKLVGKWFGNYYRMDFDSEIYFPYLIAIMQEIIYVKENKCKIINDYFGYNNKSRKLTSALKDPEYTNSIVILTWQKRIENRIIANFGQSVLQSEKREIENIVYKIKDYIFSFRNIDDMELVSDFLLDKFSEIIFSDSKALEFGLCFFNEISSRINQFNFTVDASSNAKNILSFLKTIFADQKVTNKLEEELAKRINEAYEKNMVNNEIYDKYYFEVIQNKRKRCFVVEYEINMRKGYLNFLNFYEIYDEENKHKLIDFGFGKFFE